MDLVAGGRRRRAGARSTIVDDLGLSSEGEASGNAEKLADLICSKQIFYSVPILFPCGSLKREVLPKKLQEKNVPLESITVYQTAQHPDIRSSLTDYFTKDGHNGLPGENEFIPSREPPAFSHGDYGTMISEYNTPLSPSLL
ncbi:unnamed protein product [Ranitomeya imitator]|uniref:Tetrapyrrole biosynthesis uroporphyrinogen III synthase domain-containing protein n=1 Tax=Ranitomeya imitator TaxID=111125 RepID=A0ABN9L184_9NEOB|nr:unnamed protein product [Ranitomeya imitator]